MKRLSLLCALLVLVDSTRLTFAEPTGSATAAFNLYTAAVESRLAQQHRGAASFIASATPLPNAPVIERLSPSTGADLPGALLHHWCGTAFAPGAHAADLERLLRDFNAYPQRFAPEVTDAHLLTSANRDHLQATLRVRQHHILTVTLDTAYDVTFARLDASHGYSISRSTHIDELDAADHPLADRDAHGFLYRLNTYWSWEERDGGLLIQLESVSLSRGIPHGLGWAVRPYIDSVPRESLEFTLHSALNALHK